MWHELGIALCLLFILEGMLPFLSPGLWRRFVLTAATLKDSDVRRAGLLSMLAGTVLLYFIN